MAHGLNLNADVWLDAEEVKQYSAEVEQSCVEYLADMYAVSFQSYTGLFQPQDKYDYEQGGTDFALTEIEVCIAYRDGWANALGFGG